MKGKSCDSNINTVLCIFLGILLLIVLWYVVFGKKNIESFSIVSDEEANVAIFDVNNDGNADAAAFDVDDDGDADAAVFDIDDDGDADAIASLRKNLTAGLITADTYTMGVDTLTAISNPVVNTFDRRH